MFRMTLAVTTVFVAFACLGTGCAEVQAILQSILDPSGDNGTGSNGTDGPPIPVATLTVTNPTPQLNEEVVFFCSLVGDTVAPVAFDFQPDHPRLVVNRTAGTGSIVIQETDVGGAGFAFTCTVTTAGGTSLPSNEVVVIPTGPPPPLP